jgi:10 TM Acyl Transferase domain found in Cas1p
MLGATAGAMWEWYFRSSLDHWSTLLGMTFALNFPVTSLFFRKLESLPTWPNVATKATMALVFMVAAYLWIVGPFQLAKFDYNQTNAYFGIVPVMAYIYLRNCTLWLRSHTLELLHEIGKTTLETYLMQHHIWLTSNAKSLLTLVPGWPKMNFLVVTMIYFVLSRRLYQLTLFLRGMMLPDNRTACLRNLFGMTAVLSGFLFLAGFLQFVGIMKLWTVGLVSGCFGYATYYGIVSCTWQSMAEPSQQSPRDGVTLPSMRVAKVNGHGLPGVAGAAVVLLLGLVWHHCQTNGATKIGILPAHCQAYVQQGNWTSVDTCDETARGISYRDNEIGSLGTCSAAASGSSLVWGWSSSPPASHCRFAQRDKSSLLKNLRHRNITFVGDSIVRHLYHATRRQFGDSQAGAYNTSLEKWSDYSYQYGTVDLEFRWAPYTETMLDKLSIVIDRKERPDVIVIGGGPWDRLHRYETEDERRTFDSLTKKLAEAVITVQKLDISVVWCIPTTINTWALTTDDKKVKIRETDIRDIRVIQSVVADAASFAFDGQIYTRERVGESYDGVHYPLHVYDGGSQILLNSFDWTLPSRKLPIDKFIPPRLGSMSHAILGSTVLCFILVALLTYDGFFGVSYVALLFAPEAVPYELVSAAFTTLHKRYKLPNLGLENDESASTLDEKTKDSENGEEEMVSLLADEGSDLNAHPDSTPRIPGTVRVV